MESKIKGCLPPAEEHQVADALSDSGRIERLYVDNVIAARRFAYLLVGDPFVAEDVVQEAFARVIGRLRHLRDPAAFSHYLRTAIMNVTRSQRRRRRLERAHERARMMEFDPRVDGPDVGEADLLRRALLQLPSRQRAAIVLRYYEDRSEAEIASMLECPSGTVRSLLSRGVTRLRELTRGESSG